LAGLYGGTDTSKYHRVTAPAMNRERRCARGFPRGVSTARARCSI